MGTVGLTRRVYDSDEGGCRVDRGLGLPRDGWFRIVREFASALGVGCEFGNANRLRHHWSGILVSEKILANPVEGDGQDLVSAPASHRRYDGSLTRGIEVGLAGTMPVVMEK